MTRPTDEELRAEMYFHTKPLSQIQELDQEWLLGTWTLSKSHQTWRVGYGHPLVAGATMGTIAFSHEGKPLVAVVFESQADPPWYLIGWVPANRGDEAQAWAGFLNREIANRLASRPAEKNETYDPHDGSAAMDYEDKLAEEKFEKSKLIEPYKG